MRGQSGNEVLERERELLSFINDNDPEVREQTKKDWHDFLEEHPEYSCLHGVSAHLDCSMIGILH